MTTPASPVTPLSETESWSRLSGVTLGRLATSVAGQPGIFPVNFSAVAHAARMPVIVARQS